MRTYLLRRLLALVPTLFFASLIVFFTIRLIPGDVIDLMLSQNDVAADKLSREQLVAPLPNGAVAAVVGGHSGPFGRIVVHDRVLCD